VDTHQTKSNIAGFGLRAALWVAQALVGLPFMFFGFVKMTKPIAELSIMMHWTAQLPEPFVRFMGAVDFAGGAGMLLPALTRIRPELTIWAARGCIALQICAIIFHVSRGEANLTPLNVVLLALSVFVLWGRTKRAPLTRKADASTAAG